MPRNKCGAKRLAQLNEDTPPASPLVSMDKKIVPQASSSPTPSSDEMCMEKTMVAQMFTQPELDQAVSLSRAISPNAFIPRAILPPVTTPYKAMHNTTSSYPGVHQATSLYATAPQNTLPYAMPQPTTPIYATAGQTSLPYTSSFFTTEPQWTSNYAKAHQASSHWLSQSPECLLPVTSTYAPSSCKPMAYEQIGPLQIKSTQATYGVSQNKIPINEGNSTNANLDLRLAMLDEEKKLQEHFLAKKYDILSECQSSLPPGFNQTNLRSAPTQAQIAARHAMPKDLPHFHGDPEEWPLFISSFQNSTQIAGYTNAENLIRLQSCLKGKARDMVKSRLLLPAMVPEVIETLRMCFGRPELIIESLVEKARKIQPLKDNLNTLIDFALCVRNIHATIESCHMEAYMSNPMLVKELVEKLPNNHKLNWAMSPKDPNTPVLKLFSEWLYKLAEAASHVVSITPKPQRSAIINTHTQDLSVEHRKECVYCKNDKHKVAECSKFNKLSLEQKWDAVRSLKLCRHCLNIHRRRCFASKTCGINGCAAKHHRLLHREMSTAAGTEADTKVEACVSGVVNSHDKSRNPNSPLFRILPVRIHSKNNYLDVFAFLDEGSSVTLVEESVFNYLGLSGESDPICLRWTGDQVRNEDNSVCASLQISSLQHGRRFTANKVHTVKKLGLPEQTVDMGKLTEKFAHLKGLPINSYTNVTPTILIGLDNWRLAVPLKVREGTWCQPIATKTRLGWTLQGGNGESSTRQTLNVHSCLCKDDFNKLHEIVKQSFQLDSPAPSLLTSQEDKKALMILDKTCQKVGERYETSLLWRYDDIELPDSYDTAFKRLTCLKRKFTKDPLLKQKMQTQIDNLVEKGYAKKLTNEEAQENVERVWYLPIFVTQNPNKPDKVRLVWDAAAKTNGFSLNDFIMCGPDLLTPLVDILFAFRTGRVAICGDIAEMFH